MNNPKFGLFPHPVSSVSYEAESLLLKLRFVLLKGVKQHRAFPAALLSAVPCTLFSRVCKPARPPSSSILVLPQQSWSCGLESSLVLRCFGFILKAVSA